MKIMTKKENVNLRNQITFKKKNKKKFKGRVKADMGFFILKIPGVES